MAAATAVNTELQQLKFAFKRNLQTHEKLHPEETPFACTQCGKRYKIEKSLKKHQLSHKN